MWRASAYERVFASDPPCYHVRELGGEGSLARSFRVSSRLATERSPFLLMDGSPARLQAIPARALQLRASRRWQQLDCQTPVGLEEPNVLGACGLPSAAAAATGKPCQLGDS
jgi:hypothetical protein